MTVQAQVALILNSGKRSYSISAHLHEAVASSNRRHASEVVLWSDMQAFLARRGVVINKRPRVHSIGVGECRHCIEAKVMALMTQIDTLKVCSTDQLCAGTKASIETAVHAMKELFEADKTESLLLVDAANVLHS